jgi:hypothetical protein
MLWPVEHLHHHLLLLLLLLLLLEGLAKAVWVLLIPTALHRLPMGLRLLQMATPLILTLLHQHLMVPLLRQMDRLQAEQVVPVLLPEALQALGGWLVLLMQEKPLVVRRDPAARDNPLFICPPQSSSPLSSTRLSTSTTLQRQLSTVSTPRFPQAKEFLRNPPLSAVRMLSLRERPKSINHAPLVALEASGRTPRLGVT